MNSRLTRAADPASYTENAIGSNHRTAVALTEQHIVRLLRDNMRSWNAIVRVAALLVQHRSLGREQLVAENPVDNTVRSAFGELRRKIRAKGFPQLA